MKKIRFKEEQKFNQPWIWIIIFIPTGFWLYVFIQQIIIGMPFGGNHTSDEFLIVIGIIPLAIIIMFFQIKLITIIDNEGVHYKFLPFQRKFRTIKPEEIEHYEIIKYKPIKEYGGWGIRTGYGKKGSAYNASRNIGIQFELSNGKLFLLGTQRAESFKRNLDKLMDKQ